MLNILKEQIKDNHILILGYAEKDILLSIEFWKWEDLLPSRLQIRIRFSFRILSKHYAASIIWTRWMIMT